MMKMAGNMMSNMSPEEITKMQKVPRLKCTLLSCLLQQMATDMQASGAMGAGGQPDPEVVSKMMEVPAWCTGWS